MSTDPTPTRGLHRVQTPAARSLGVSSVPGLPQLLRSANTRGRPSHSGAARRVGFLWLFVSLAQFTDSFLVIFLSLIQAFCVQNSGGSFKLASHDRTIITFGLSQQFYQVPPR